MRRRSTCSARAVINRPKLLLADEPTSSLDDARAEQVLRLLIQQADRHEATLIIATHDARIAGAFQRHLLLDEQPPTLRQQPVLPVEAYAIDPSTRP